MKQVTDALAAMVPVALGVAAGMFIYNWGSKKLGA